MTFSPITSKCSKKMREYLNIWPIVTADLAMCYVALLHYPMEATPFNWLIPRKNHLTSFIFPIASMVGLHIPYKLAF